MGKFKEIPDASIHTIMIVSESLNPIRLDHLYNSTHKETFLAKLSQELSIFSTQCNWLSENDECLKKQHIDLQKGLRTYS